MKCQVQTKLQDSGWEVYETYDDLASARAAIKKLKKGCLGMSSMYQIINENNEIYLEAKKRFESQEEARKRFAECTAECTATCESCDGMGGESVVEAKEFGGESHHWRCCPRCNGKGKVCPEDDLRRKVERIKRIIAEELPEGWRLVKDA